MQMDGPMDWNANVTVHERDDAGSDMYFEFKTVNKGPLGAMVRHIAGLPAADRARLVIDLGPDGTINMTQIMALATRADFPGGAMENDA